jgi:MFS transporter, ACS family, allantoate permease
MCLVYGLNYLDKTTLSYASVMGISDTIEKGGIGLHGDQYSWLGRFVPLLNSNCILDVKLSASYSMFYFGYLAWEYPTNR